MRYFEKREIILFRNQFKWFLLCIQGGFLNALGFLYLGLYFSHVTGSATAVGMNIAKERVSIDVRILMVPFWFIFGGLISGLFVERRILHLKKPYYFIPLIIMSTVLGLLILLTYSGTMGSIADYSSSLRDMIFLSSMSFVCGLQNAVISGATANLIRTTHMTGNATDISLTFVRYWYQKDHVKKTEELHWLNLRMGLFISFIIGAIMATWLYIKYGLFSLLFPFLISILLVVYSFSHHQRPKLDRESA